jgi:hypothetical protein
MGGGMGFGAACPALKHAGRQFARDGGSSFIASSIAHSFFDQHPFQGGRTSPERRGPGLGTEGYDNAGAEPLEADYGDFDGGDFGGGDIEI